MNRRKTARDIDTIDSLVTLTIEDEKAISYFIQARKDKHTKKAVLLTIRKKSRKAVGTSACW